MEGISRRALARKAGVNESSVRKHIASGALDEALLADGSLHPEKAVKLLRAVITRGHLAAPALRKATDRFTAAQVGLLEDEVADLQRRHIPVEVAARNVRAMTDRLASHLRPLTAAIATAAGLPAGLVHDHARTCVHNALKAISGDFLAGDEWWDQPIDAWWEEPAADAPRSMSAVALKTAKLDLGATKLNIQRMIANGEVRSVAEVVREAGERVATAKSVLLAIPSRVDQRLSAATPAEAIALVTREVAGVFRELGVTP